MDSVYNFSLPRKRLESWVPKNCLIDMQYRMYNIYFSYESHPNRSHIPEYPPIFIAFVVCLLNFPVHCYFLSMPKNVAGRIGEQAVMNCASNDTTRPCGNLVWVRHDPKTSEQIYISHQDQLSSLVSQYIAFTDSSNGNCNLNITVQKSSEGTYECTDATTLKAVTAQLIVLEDDPECVVRTGNKVFKITCSVRFVGSWFPTMQWFQVNGTNSIPIDASESIIPGQVVSSTALLNRVDVSDERGRKTVGLRCSMNFSEDRRPDETSATNVPDYEWISPIFGGGNEKQLDDTCNDGQDNNDPYVAAIAILGVVLVIVLAILAVCAFAQLRRKKSRRQDGPTIAQENGEL